MRAAGPPLRAAIGDPVGSLWRALAAFRFLLLLFAAGTTVVQQHAYARPGLAWLVIGGLAGWTVAVGWLYARPRRRRVPLFVADLLVALAALAVSPVAQGAAATAGDPATVPTFWIAAPVLACALRWGAWGGLLAAGGVEAADLSLRVHLATTAVGNAFLMVMAGIVVGYCATLVRTAAADRAEAAARLAATRERERLSRAVHDGVLQVLAYVHRRGAEIGGETGELGRLAGEQERALRDLVRRTGDDPGPGAGARADGGTDGSTGDLARLLGGLAGPGVAVSLPGGPVPWPAPAAAELVAAVRAALDNAARHAPGAPVHVLLEDDGEGVTVSVRDEGPGIAAGRLDEARGQGRMGVSRSIVGRLADLGGSASLDSVPGEGTEWELRVPRAVPS